jgi:hypothetical protein
MDAANSLTLWCCRTVCNGVSEVADEWNGFDVAIPVRLANESAIQRSLSYPKVTRR